MPSSSPSGALPPAAESPAELDAARDRRRTNAPGAAPPGQSIFHALFFSNFDMRRPISGGKSYSDIIGRIPNKSQYKLQGATQMLTLEELKQDRNLIDAINWDMTPEEAVRLYLEWGNNWARGDGYVIRSKGDYTVYFVVNCWSRPYFIYLIKRNSDEAVEMARVELPKRFEKPVCELKGIYAPEGEVKAWLKEALGVA
jgi:hypothetical protein